MYIFVLNKTALTLLSINKVYHKQEETTRISSKQEKKKEKNVQIVCKPDRISHLSFNYCKFKFDIAFPLTIIDRWC